MNISATKELVVCLHSLPHSDLTSDYPMFSWALTDQPYETPQRKFPEKLRSDLEGDTVSKDDSRSRNRSQDKPYSFSPSHVVRKLQFENVSLAAAISSEKQQWVEKDADMPVVETFENIKTTKTKHSVCLTEWDFSDISATRQTSKYFAKGMQNLVLNKNEAVNPRGVSNDDISITHSDLCRTLVRSDSRQDPKLSCKEMKTDKQNQADKQGSFYERFSDFSQSGICEAKESNVSARKALKSSTISKEQMQDQGICEIMQSFRNDEISRKTDSYDFVSKRAHECEQKFISVENQVLERCRDSENVRSKNLNSEFRPQEIFRKSLLTRSVGARSSGHTTSNEDFSPSKVCGDTRRKLGCSNDRRLKGFERTSLDRPRSNSESSKTKAYSNLRSKEMITDKDRKSSPVLEEQQRSNLRRLNPTTQKSLNIFDEYGNVLDRTEKDIGDILPEVRHVMDNDYEKNLNKRLSKCCSLSRNSSEKEEDGSKGKKLEGTVKTEVSHGRSLAKHKSSLLILLM